MRFFMTGATGFVGSRIAAKLRDNNYKVNAIVRNPDRADFLRRLGVQVFQGDVTDKDSMRAAMQGCDGVFHVAGWYKIGVRDKSPGYKINVQGTRNVLGLMQELGIRKGVYTSTVAVNSDTHAEAKDESFQFMGEHISEYDRTKAGAHEIALTFIKNGLPLVILMPGLIYGPDGASLSDESLRLYLQGKLPMIPKRSAFCWSHVDDIADAHLLAMQKADPGTTYMITGPCHTLTEAFDMAEQITGLKAPMAVPPALLKITAFFSSLIEWIVPLPPLYSSEALRVQAGVTYLGDNSSARRDLGYHPRPLSKGLKETLLYERSRLNSVDL
ncbi:MAG: NAD-dependent epimerase/dehydratase family protein [candidate division KSB1 bacterium]|nr:NAD-dependent epimerase/dehydratase family protein [candidate division KSB1 bacterium]